MEDSLQRVVERYIRAAESFCGLIDSARAVSRSAFLSRLHVALAELLIAGVQLPFREPDTEELSGEAGSPSRWAQQVTSLEVKLRDTLGPNELYWAVFDPSEKQEPVQASLATDLAEVYWDLKEDLSLLEKHGPTGDVIWGLRESFREHWGRHGVGALGAVHHLVCLEAIEPE